MDIDIPTPTPKQQCTIDSRNLKSIYPSALNASLSEQMSASTPPDDLASQI